MVKRRALGLPLWAGLIVVLFPALAAGQPASLLLDINTTPRENDFGPQGSFSDLRESGGKLYFNGVAGGAGSELWVSDGTSTGTQILRDLCPGTCNGGGDLLGGLG